MFWPIIASLALVISAYAQVQKRLLVVRMVNIAFYLALILWPWIAAGLSAFRGGEAGLLGWFILGLTFLLLEQVLLWRGEIFSKLSVVFVPLAALCFSLGFDVLRPDAYSYVPATILGLFVLLVASRAYLRLARGLKKKNGSSARLFLAAYIFFVALVLYSALFKMIDRGWLLPWSYLASAGALLFASAQLWMGWEELLKQKRAPAWLRDGAANMGVLLMVVAAFFVYRQFL